MLMDDGAAEADIVLDGVGDGFVVGSDDAGLEGVAASVGREGGTARVPHAYGAPVSGSPPCHVACT